MRAKTEILGLVALASVFAIFVSCSPSPDPLPDHSDGRFDETFATGSGAAGWVFGAAAQPDDKLIVVGDLSSYNGATITTGTHLGYSGDTVKNNGIVRIKTDGSLDTTFATTGAGADGYVWCDAIQGDGKVLVGGDFTHYNGASYGHIVRLNADGSVDTLFNAAGAGFNGQIFAILPLTSGKILVGGGYNTYNGTPVSCIVRLNSDGSLDTTYPTATVPTVRSIALWSEGKVLVGCDVGSSTGTSLFLLAANGIVDTSFSFPITASYTSIWSLAVLPDGKILAGGYLDRGDSEKANRGLVRLNVDGSIDATFNLGGAGVDVVDPNEAGHYGAVFDINVLSDGKLLIGGTFVSYNGQAVPYFARLKPDGTVDSDFKSGAGPNYNVRHIIKLSTGKLLIIGDFGTYDGHESRNIARIWS